MSTVLALPEFSEFSATERARMAVEIDIALEPERAWALDEPFVDSGAICRRAVELEWVQPDLAKDKYGVVSPIRSRQPHENDALGAQSYPLLATAARQYLRTLAVELHEEVARGADLSEIDDFAFSITSLLRTTDYQHMIAKAGKLASVPSGDFASSHCYGIAFDIDHGGGYVQRDGVWLTANPRRDFELWRPVRAQLRSVLPEVVGSDIERGVINVIDEIPDGWGVYHVAVKPKAKKERNL